MADWTGKVVFHPWKGKLYGESFSKEGLLTSKNRLLVMGESHYGDDVKKEDLKNLTKDVVERYVFKRKTSYPFFDNITSVLRGKSVKLKESDFEKIWNKIAYYNFVQTLLPKATVRPTPNDFKASETPFWEILKKLEPTHIWVCGKVLWGGMPDDKFECPDTITNGRMVGEAGIYKLNGNEIRAVATWHPSPRFRKFICDDWRSIVQQFLELPIDRGIPTPLFGKCS